MLQNKLFPLLIACCLSGQAGAQVLSLDAILDSITIAHPVLKMYDDEIRSMDEAAKGARSWMPPQFGVGQFMTPYDVSLWKKNGDEPGMGSVMFSGEQMFPNRKKLDAEAAYMNAMSSVEKEKKNATVNELVSAAKSYYYEWVILKKKLHILSGNEQLLSFMINTATLRYKNGVDKINVFYKASAALGEIKNMQLMYTSMINEKRIRLNALMGRNALTMFDIDTTYRLNDYNSMHFDTTLFYASRSDLKSIDQEISLAMLKTESEKQNLKPQFGIRYDHMIGFGGQPMLYTIMGMVKIPMAGWSSKMTKSTIESLKWKTSALASEKAMLVNEYSGMAYGMRNELELKKSQLKLYETTILPALQKNYGAMQLAYEQNTEELFMLFDAWESLNMKQLEYVTILNEALMLQVSIERIIEKR